MPNSLAAAPQGPLDRNLLVVCEMTPRAVERHYFAEVLAKNRVAVENVSLQSESLMVEDRVDPAIRESAKDDAVFGERKAGRASKNVEKRWDSDASGVPQQTVYLVEASQQQLADVLAELQQDRQEVLAVNVDPAPQIPAQKQLFAYTRDEMANGSLYVTPELQLDSLAADRPANGSDSPAPVAGSAVQSPARNEPAQPNQAAAEEKPAPLSLTESNQQLTTEQAGANAWHEQEDSDAYYRQNQIRQQIPVEEQRVLLSELEEFSNTATTGKPPERAPVTVQNAQLGNGRARQLELNQLRRIDNRRRSQVEYSAIAKDGSRPSAPVQMKSSGPEQLQSLNDNGVSPKDGAAIPPTDNNQTRFGTAAKPADQALPRVSKQSPPGTSTEGQRSLNRSERAKTAPVEKPAEEAAVNQAAVDPFESAEDQEPLVKAVFVIQSREPADVKQPASNSETPAAPNPSPR